MSGQLVKSGPYTGGLNTHADPSAIDDNQLVVADNVEVDDDGSMKTRPPFVDRGISMPLQSTGDMRILGTYQSANANYIIASDGVSRTYYFDGTTWHNMVAGFAALDMVQFNGQLWLVNPAGPGGYWVPGAFTASPNMPPGTAITAYKGLMFVTSSDPTTPSRLFYSGQITPFWQSSNEFFDVNYGDGQTNIELLVLFNALIIFRSSSIWSFSFSTDPAFGSQSLVVDGIGVASRQAVNVFEGLAYFMFNGRAYSLNGSTASQLNTEVPFVAGVRAGCYSPFVVSVVNRRIIFSYYDTLYVFNLRSRNWTTWHSPTYGGIGKILEYQGSTTSDMVQAIAHSNFSATGTTRVATTLFFTDAFTSEAEAAPYTCTMQTKVYDYGSASRYKKLFWWGADLVYRTALSATVTPVVYSSQVTWGQMKTTTWGQALRFTWGHPSTGSLDVTTTVAGVSAGSGPLKKFVRFGKSLRFRHIYYTIALTVDGSNTTSPAKVFELSTFVDLKQTVSKTVS